MTPTEKDALALAVLDKHLAAMAAGRPSVSCKHLTFYDESRQAFTEARAHLAARLYLLGGEAARFEQLANSLSEKIARMEDCITHERARATRAEAELAAVRANAERYLHLREANNADPTPFIAQRYEHGIMQWTGEEADAAIDAARGGE